MNRILSSLGAIPLHIFHMWRTMKRSLRRCKDMSPNFLIVPSSVGVELYQFLLRMLFAHFRAHGYPISLSGSKVESSIQDSSVPMIYIEVSLCHYFWYEKC